jgi:hypothetical protein
LDPVPGDRPCLVGGAADREYHCRLDTSRGVTLVRETGRTHCIRGYSWDYDSGDIWTDHGCAAEFLLASRRPLNWETETPPQGEYLISCGREAGERDYCIEVPQASVELVRQTSNAKCVEGKSWGSDPRGIWVADGCTADFLVKNNLITDIDEAGTKRLVECSSTDGKRNFCQADTRGGAVLRMVVGHASCKFGESWDFSEGGVWVDHGCRGVFEVEGATETGQGSLSFRRCYSSVGETLASEWEAECYELRPGHFASCNARNSCAELTTTIRRACKARGEEAPDYCEKYLAETEQADSSSSTQQ